MPKAEHCLSAFDFVASNLVVEISVVDVAVFVGDGADVTLLGFVVIIVVVVQLQVYVFLQEANVSIKSIIAKSSLFIIQR